MSAVQHIINVKSNLDIVRLKQWHDVLFGINGNIVNEYVAYDLDFPELYFKTRINVGQVHKPSSPFHPVKYDDDIQLACNSHKHSKQLNRKLRANIGSNSTLPANAFQLSYMSFGLNDQLRWTINFYNIRTNCGRPSTRACQTCDMWCYQGFGDDYSTEDSEAVMDKMIKYFGPG